MTLEHKHDQIEALETAGHWEKIGAQSSDPGLKADALMMVDYHIWIAKLKKAELDLIDWKTRAPGEFAGEVEAVLRGKIDELSKQRPEWKAFCAAVTARMAARESEQTAPATSNPIIWKGTEVELAATIITWREKGLITGYDSEREAIRMCAPHFVKQTKDGKVKNIDPESLARNYEQMKRK